MYKRQPPTPTLSSTRTFVNLDALPLGLRPSPCLGGVDELHARLRSVERAQAQAADVVSAQARFLGGSDRGFLGGAFEGWGRRGDVASDGSLDGSVIATGLRSAALGTSSSAEGNYSLAAGEATLSSGEASMALGKGVAATGDGAAALGVYTLSQGRRVLRGWRWRRPRRPILRARRRNDRVGGGIHVLRGPDPSQGHGVHRHGRQDHRHGRGIHRVGSAVRVPGEGFTRRR